MGLTNMLAIFIQIVNNLFMDLLDKRRVVFLENVLRYSITTEEHFKLLEKVFTCLHKHAFYCKLKKYSFLYEITTFMGFDVTLESICISDAKVISLKEWLKPATIYFWVFFSIFIYLSKDLAELLSCYTC